jgi:hypothetical protein
VLLARSSCVNTSAGSWRIVFQIRFGASVSIDYPIRVWYQPELGWRGFMAVMGGSWMNFLFGREVIS